VEKKTGLPCDEGGRGSRRAEKEKPFTNLEKAPLLKKTLQGGRPAKSRRRLLTILRGRGKGKTLFTAKKRGQGRRPFVCVEGENPTPQLPGKGRGVLTRLLITLPRDPVQYPTIGKEKNCKSIVLRASYLENEGYRGS